MLWLARYSPEFNRKEREWRLLKRDARGHLARTLREFVDGILAGLGRLGGERLDIADRVPDWWLAGHRKPPTGRPAGRPKGAKDTQPRAPRRTNLPAPTYPSLAQTSGSMRQVCIRNDHMSQYRPASARDGWHHAGVPPGEGSRWPRTAGQTPVMARPAGGLGWAAVRRVQPARICRGGTRDIGRWQIPFCLTSLPPAAASLGETWVLTAFFRGVWRCHSRSA